MPETKEIYKKINKFNERELKELSILFLIINNLDVFRKNIELISEIVISSPTINEFKQKLMDYLLAEKFFNRKQLVVEDFETRFHGTINLINNEAPIKIIHKSRSDEEIVSTFNEILKEIRKIELRKKIETLEDKVSLNLNESLYTELLSLRNQLKEG